MSTRWSWVTLQELGLLKLWVGMTHTHIHFPATGPQQIKSSILNTVKCLISCYDVQTEHDLCLGNMSYFYVLSQRTSTFCLSFVTTTCTSDFLIPLRSSIIGEAAETLWSGRAFKTFIIIIITTLLFDHMYFSDVPI